MSAQNPLLEASLHHLQALVAHDTRNPPRAIDSHGIFDYLRAQLPDFAIEVTDHGAGAVSMLAVRGTPGLLFNVHLDTVPDSPAWSRDPHQLQVIEDRAIGLGACDIKGAAAGLLAAAQATQGDLALLFTTDEEANDARCIRAFLADCPASSRRFRAVVVAEPTQSRAVLAHRGILSAKLAFHGRAGHASAQLQLADSAVHQALEWGHAALGLVQSMQQREFGGLQGLRLNIGRIEGGIKGNMVAPDAHLLLNTRPLPDMDIDALLAQLRGMGLPSMDLTETFRGPALPAGGPERAEQRHADAAALANELGIEQAEAVDFWTEAAKFSAAGYVCFVYGPGDIAQAHSADEWLALPQLASYAGTIARIVEEGRA